MKKQLSLVSLLLAVCSCIFAQNATAELLQAAKTNNVERISYFVSKRVNINESDENGTTPLMVAAMYNRLEAAELLIKKGANIYFKDKHLRNAIILAAKNGSVDVARLLIQKGAFLNEVDDEGKTALAYAGKKSEIGKMLLAAGAEEFVFGAELPPVTYLEPFVIDE